MPEPLYLAQLEAADPRAPQGVERRFCCPFCGDGKARDAAHRSLNVNTQNGAFVCQRCKESGKLADFWEERPQTNRRDFARQQLQRATALPTAATPPSDEAQIEAQAKADRLTAQLESARPLEGTSGAAYLLGRGVSVEVASAAGVQFCPDWMKSPKWRGCAAVIFPIRNRAGDIVAAQGREIGGAGKFSLGPKSQGIFATAGALDSKRLIIAEAPIDALSLAVAGCPAVALCGTSGPDWLPKFCYRRRVLLAFDADDAGDDAARDLMPKLESFGATCERLRPEGAKDWNELLNVSGSDEIRRQIAAPTVAEVHARSARYWASKRAENEQKEQI
jgi:DNA primase